MFCVLLYKYIYTCINLYFISRLSQDSLTLPYTRQTPPPQKKIHSRPIISFADRKSDQMCRPTNAFDLVVGIAKGIFTLAN